jgi:hypothetical protein
MAPLAAANATTPHAPHPHAAILLSRREQPCVVLTQNPEDGEPSLPPEQVRLILGDTARIYLLEDEHGLAYLRTRLGGPLALARGMTRIYWPNLSVQSDPLDHPVIPTLADEPVESTLGELARQFNLSRPNDHRSVLQAQIATREKELRNTRAELASVTTRLHETAARLRTAEAELIASARRRGSEPGKA